MAKNPINVNVETSQEGLKTRYENMLHNVAKMLDDDGPIYTTWIYFQIGTKGKYITFNSSSQDTKQNLIANLDIEKTCSGIANSFTLTVYYDPFNYGQDTQDKIEILDEFIATAMAEDFNDDTSSCRGKIQYGYNSTSASDDSLVSPIYTFFLTGATSNVKFDSGIAMYTFTGTSVLSAECDYVTSYDEIKDTPLLQAVGKLLYKYYGDPDHPPIKSISEGITPISGETKYRIDINDNDITNSQTINEEKSSITQSPWLYCKSLLDKYPLTKEEAESEEFKDLSKVSLNKRPKYSMYITDTDDKPTIHIVHFAPSSTVENGKEVSVEQSALSLNYTFSWGTKQDNLSNKNIVIGWKPEVDLYTYLIRSALHKRYEKLKELKDTDPAKYGKAYDDLAEYYSEDVVEMYNAEIELIGIPADPPMAAEVEIIPRVCENVSRTAGIYAITGASDSISNTGTFTSTLKLFRLRSANADKSSLTKNETAQETKSEKVYVDLYNYVYVTPEEKKAMQNKTYTRTIQPPDYTNMDIKLVQ